MFLFLIWTQSFHCIRKLETLKISYFELVSLAKQQKFRCGNRINKIICLSLNWPIIITLKRKCPQLCQFLLLTFRKETFKQQIGNWKDNCIVLPLLFRTYEHILLHMLKGWGTMPKIRSNWAECHSEIEPYKKLMAWMGWHFFQFVDFCQFW